MAFIDGAGLVALLPSGTAVTTAEADRFISAAKVRLGASHIATAADDPITALPDTNETEDLVEQMAYARGIERHYLKGEGAIEVPAAKDALDRAERAFAAYDSRHVTEAEETLEAPLAIVEESPF